MKKLLMLALICAQNIRGRFSLLIKVNRVSTIVHKFELKRAFTTHLPCIGTEVIPVSKGEGTFPSDNDNSWKTIANPYIIPVKRENFSVRPELITFDAYNTLIEPNQSIGR
jgi:hypothetical protein